MFLISKSGPKAETVAGESSSAISTIGLDTKTPKIGDEGGSSKPLVYRKVQ
jgi:hypothetical protein